MSERIRVGLYMYSPGLGGAESYVADLIAGLDRSHFEPTFFGPPWPARDRFLRLAEHAVTAVPVTALDPGAKRSGTDENGPSEHGAQVPASLARRLLARLPGRSWVREPARLAMHSVYWRYNRRAVKRALVSCPVDVFHVVNGGYPGSGSARAASAAAMEAGVPARVMTVCSTALPRALPVLEARLDDAVVRSVHRVIVPARRPGDELVRLRDFDKAQLRTIPWGVTAPSAANARDRASARKALGLPQDALVVGSIGNFTPQKGQAATVRAIAAIGNRHPSLRVLLAGSGAELDSVRSLVTSLGLDDVITLVGRISDRFAFLRALDLFVLASEIEGLPLVVLEALSQGCPVVATDVGGMAEAVIDGETGWLVRPGDPVALARSLDAALGARLASYRTAARALYDERFTLTAMVSAHEALYRELMST